MLSIDVILARPVSLLRRSRPRHLNRTLPIPRKACERYLKPVKGLADDLDFSRIRRRTTRPIYRERFSARYQHPSELIRTRPDPRVENWSTQKMNNRSIERCIDWRTARGLSFFRQASGAPSWSAGLKRPAAAVSRTHLAVTHSIGDRWGVWTASVS